MYRLYFIAKNNVKKKKSDALVLTGLIMLAVMMMYVSLTVLLGAGKRLDECYEKTNAFDWHIAAQKEGCEGITDILKAQEETKKLEVSDVLYVPVVKYRIGDSEEKEFSFTFVDGNREYEIGKVNSDFEGTLADNQILLPYYMHASEGCEIGDEITMSIGKEEMDFEVAGFSEDPMYASPLMIALYQAFVTQDVVEQLKEMDTEVMDGYLWKVQLKEGTDIAAFDTKMLGQIKRDVPALSQSFCTWSFDREIAKLGTLMMANVSMAILLVFAMILLAVTMIILRFSIANFCELNMRNIGVLRASGYTSKELVGSFMMEMFLLTVIGSVLGVLLGVVCGDWVGGVVGYLIGLSYQAGFDVVSAGVVFVFCVVIVLLMTWHCSRPFGKIPVLDALREGIVTHNFRKNHIVLEKSRQPLAFALGMKSILYAKAKNLGILCIVAILSLSSCIGFSMYQNFAKDTSYMLSLVGQECGDASYVGEDLEELGSKIEKLDKVDRVLYVRVLNLNVSVGEKEVNLPCSAWKEPEKRVNHSMLEGRYPEYENEVMLTKAACDRLDVSIGDTVYLEGIEGKKDYIVVGVDQCMSNLGMGAFTNFEGMKRVNGECAAQQIYIYGTGELTYQEMLDYLNETFPDREAFDIVEGTQSVTGIVALAMELMCGVFLAVTVIVVFLVVYLLVKAKVIRERKNYGLYKAIGFTTGQLCMQTILSNLPVMVTGAVIGAVSSHWLASKVALLGLSTCGIEKCEMSVALHYMVITVVMITVVAFVVALGCSLRIRKIEPVKMLTEE